MKRRRISTHGNADERSVALTTMKGIARHIRRIVTEDLAWVTVEVG